jgi:type IV pilus assembly protein PilM
MGCGQDSGSTMGEGKNLVGVDIGSGAIKVCQVKETRKGLVVQRLGVAPLPYRTIVDGQVVDRKLVSDTVRGLLSEAKIGAKDVALSISGQSVIIRKISVPLMTAAELSEQITWEAEQHIPFDIKDVTVDYQVLRERHDASQMDLLLVAAKKDQIESYAQLARDAKCKPQLVDIDAFAIQNAFELAVGLDPTKNLALINVGASTTSLNIISRGVSAFTREIANGGNTVTEAVARHLAIPFEQAEEQKLAISAGRAGSDQVAAVIEQALDGIAAEIQRSLDFYMATSGESDIGQLYLSGGTANFSSFANAVQRRARVPVSSWSPASAFTFDPKVNPSLVSQYGLQLAVVLGLTLRKDREVKA